MSLLKPGQSTSRVPDKLSKMDYYQIITSALMVILGAIILFRSLSQGIMLMPVLVGGGFLALGVYRLNFVVRHFWERKKWNHR
jgi:uncharacterized membrane protein HdeD (DUF308 family)